MPTAKGMTVRITAEGFKQTQEEREFQQKVTDFCDLLGLKWHHEVDSRRSKRGFPDLVIAGREVVFAELKRENGVVSTEQQQWYDRLRAAGANVYIWRPSQWDEVERVLLWLAGRRVVSGP